MYRVNRLFCFILSLVIIVSSSCCKNNSEETNVSETNGEINWTPYYKVEKQLIDANNVLDEALACDGCAILRYEGDEFSPRYFISYYDDLGICRTDVDISEIIDDIYCVDLICVTPQGEVCISGLLYEGEIGDCTPFCAFFSQEGELKRSIRLNSSHLVSRLLDLTVLDDETILLTADCHGQTEFLVFNRDGSSEYSVDLDFANAEIICTKERILLFDLGYTKLYEVLDQNTVEVEDLSLDAIRLFSYSNEVLWTNENGLYELGSSDPVLKWDDIFLTSIPDHIQILDSGVMIFLTHSSYSGRRSLFKLTPSSQNPYPEMKTITIAGCDLRSDASLMYALEMMNEGNPSCRYVLRDYCDEFDYDSSQPLEKRIREKMRLEVANGKTPDIYFDKYKDLDLRDFCKEDYLIDLSCFLSDSKDDYNYEVLTLHQDTPYVICSDFSINCFSILSETLSSIDEWDYDSFYQAFASFDDGAYAQGVYTREQLLYSALSMDIQNYINYDTGQCDFHQESFGQMLKWVKDFGVEEAWTRSGYWDLKDRKIMLDFEQFNGICNYLFEKYDTQDLSWVGYPNAPGELAYSARNLYAISALSTNVEESWEFIECVLSDECQATVMDNPVRNSALYQKMELEFDAYTDANSSLPIDRKSEILKEYEDILYKTVVCDNFMSTELFDIVYEEANPYFYGDRSLETCIDLIETRAEIYINEVT